MAAVVIDSPRWRDGWGEPLSSAPAPRPALRLVDSGCRRPNAAVLRRRRLAAIALVGLLVAVAFAVASLLLTRPASAGALPVGRATHVVQPGETYWSIAAGLPHDGDLRITVDQLIDANGARPLFAGDRIELP
jgi:Tfp pilus assembly protein FimV